MGRLAWTLAVLLCLAAPAVADIIHYKDGRKLEGVILERTATEITVETSFGTIRVALSKIARIEEKLTLAQELAQHRAELDDDDAPAIYQLALWAEEHKLRKEKTELLLEVIAADPGHRDAHTKLGHVDVDGVWMEADEVDAYLERVAEQKLAEGLLFHEGAWLPEAEVMAARDMQLFHDEWLPRRDAETRQALEDLVALAAYEAQASAGEYVTIFSSTLSEDELESLLFDLDAEVRDFCDRLQLNELERAQVLRYDIPIYLLPDQETSDRVVSAGFTRRYGHTEAELEGLLGERSFGTQWRRPLLVLVEGEYLDSVGDRESLRRGILSHQIGHLLVVRLKGSRDAPGWARVGLAAFYEGATNYYTTLTLTSDNVDDAGNPISLWAGGWENFSDWQTNLSDENMLGSIRNVQRLFGRPWTDMDSRDVAVCWSFVSFLLEKHPVEFAEYMRVYNTEPTRVPQPLLRLHERAWTRSFASGSDELETRWRHWVLALPPRFPSDPLGR